MSATPEKTNRLHSLPSDWPDRMLSQNVEVQSESGTLTYHVQISGEGPDIVLLHGTGASLHSWYRLAPLLKGFRVIRMDLPGHGWTDPLPVTAGLNDMSSSIRLLIKKLDLAPVALIGHSAGAAIALDLAAPPALPSIKKVILINAALLEYGGIFQVVFKPLTRFLAQTDFAARMAAGKARQLVAVERLIEGTGSRLPDQDIIYYQHLFTSENHVKQTLRMMADWNLKPLFHKLSKIQIPVYSLTGEDDLSVVPEKASKRLAQIRDIKSVCLPELGHLMHEEAPEKCAELILDVLRPLI